MCALKIKQTNLIFDPEKNYFEPVSELQKKKKCNQRFFKVIYSFNFILFWEQRGL